MKTPDLSRVTAMYSAAFREHGDTPASVFMPKGRQDLRFESLTRHFGKGRFSVLDFGCGLAHLYDFLLQRGVPFDYTGADIVPEFINHGKEKLPQSDFRMITAVQEVTGSFDHVVVCGVFNILYQPDHVRQSEYVFESLRHLFGCCRVSLSVNFMTDKVDFEQPGAYHQALAPLLDFCREHLTSRLFLDHSYMPYEYSLILMRDAVIDRPANVFRPLDGA